MRIWLCLLLTASLLTSCQTASKKASPSPKNQSENTTRTQSVQKHGPKGLSNKTGKAAQNNTINKSNTGKATGKNQQKNRQAHLESLAKQVPGV
ncbi:MAG TPA: hypothetical protein VGN02_02885, partial [Paenibacillus sp.]